MRKRTRAALAGTLVLALGVTMGMTAADAAKKGKKKKGGSVARVTKTVNAAVPDAPASGPATPIKSTVQVGKKFKGKVVGDLDVTGITTTGSAAGAANDLIFKVTAPNGRTVRLTAGRGGQSIGPWTLNDETRTSICSSDTPSCADPDATLIHPFAGTSNMLETGAGGTGPLSVFDGLKMQGTWTMTVFDQDDPTTSTFDSWGLKITAAKPGQVLSSKKKGASVFTGSGPGVAVPDDPGAGRPTEVYSTINVPKSFKGRVVGDVNVTGIRATGGGANQVDDLVLHLIAPNGHTVRLIDGIGDSSIGPLTLDDDTPRAICDDATAVCPDPDASLVQPFAGTASMLSLGDGGTGPLAKLNGIPMQGGWRLAAMDDSTGGTVTLDGWGLKITAAKPVPGSKPAAKAAAKKKPKKGKSSIAITKAVNQAVPQDAPAGPSTPVRSTITISGKAFKGKTVGDLNVTGIRTTGSASNAASDLVAKLTAPDGRTVRLFLAAAGQSLGPWTADDDTHLSNCFNPDVNVCAPPFDLPPPWAGTSNLLFLAGGGTGPLSAFNGSPIPGTWTFTMYDDDANPRTSTFDSWGLKITATKPLKG